MKIDHLKLAELQDGDILLKLSDGSFLNTLISTMELAFTDTRLRDAVVTHAGIYFDDAIIEVNGEGLNRDALSDKAHKDLHYLVYRANAVPVVYNIAGLAYQMHLRSGNKTERGRKLGYSTSGAFASLFRRGDDTEAALLASIETEVGLNYTRGGASQFCSEFVTVCIQYAFKNAGFKLTKKDLGGLIISAKAMTPANLVKALGGSDHFRCVGYLPGGKARL